MAIVPENNKYLELEKVRAYYDEESNTIKLISKDEALKGKPFSITLKPGTSAENTVREVMEQFNVIGEGSQPFLEEAKNSPSSMMPRDFWGEIIFGESPEGKRVSVSVDEGPSSSLILGSDEAVQEAYASITQTALSFPKTWILYEGDLSGRGFVSEPRHHQRKTAKYLSNTLQLMRDVRDDQMHRLAFLESDSAADWRDMGLQPIMLALRGLTPPVGRRAMEDHAFREYHALLESLLESAERSGVFVFLFVDKTKNLTDSLRSSFPNRVGAFVSSAASDMSDALGSAAGETPSNVVRFADSSVENVRRFL